MILPGGKTKSSTIIDSTWAAHHMSHQLSLLSQQGRELLEILAGENVDPERALQLAESLRGRYPPDLLAAALTQQALRISARSKFSRANAMLFTRPGLEQASSELAARHSAARYVDARIVADLCCGIGGNLAALAAGRRAIAVDRDLVSLEFARHNAAVCREPDTGAAHTGAAHSSPAHCSPAHDSAAHDSAAHDSPAHSAAADGLAAVCADVRDLRLAGASRGTAPAGSESSRALAGVDAVFIDPARRAGGRRLRAGQSEPPLRWCLDLADRIPAVGIKAAPGLPHELVPPGWEIEFLAIGRSLKEALIWSPALATARRRATVLPSAVPAGSPSGRAAGLPSGDTLISAPGPEVPVAAPGAFLLDPSPAVTRAGLVEELARELGAWKIDPMIAFLAADTPLRTPFGRTLRVLESAPWNEKAFARRLRALGIGAADIRRRGLAGDVRQIHRRLGLQGEGSATIVITRMNGKPWGLICAPAGDDERGS
jgi:SAM-dependent methyltransferase